MKKFLILFLSLIIQDSFSKVPFNNTSAQENDLELRALEDFLVLPVGENDLVSRLEREARENALLIINSLRQKIEYFLFKKSILFNENFDLNIDGRAFENVILETIQFKFSIVNIINLLNYLAELYSDLVDVPLFILDREDLSINRLLNDFEEELKTIDRALAKAYFLQS